MKKAYFHDEMNEIDFPEQEAFQAISKGIEQGKNEKKPKKKQSIKKYAWITSIAASAFLVSGLYFSPVSNVLASVPFIGSIYEKFNLELGAELSNRQLVTALNETASNNGVDITIMDAYYEGDKVGLSFNVEGEDVTLDFDREREPESGYSFHLFDGKEQKQWSGGHSQLEQEGNGYIAAIELSSSETTLPERFTLPVTFTRITGIKGTWQFEIPLERLPYETVQLNSENELAGGYSLTVNTLSKGQATTVIDYTTFYPNDLKYDQIDFKIYDDRNNVITKHAGNILSSQENEVGVMKENRLTINQEVNQEVEYLTVYPEIRHTEQPTVLTLDQEGEFLVKSNRFDYTIKVNKVEQDKNKVRIDYHIQGVSPDRIREDIIENFADHISLIQTENIIFDEGGELDMNKSINGTIRSDETVRIDKENWHFQSEFPVQLEDEADRGNYSIMVGFGTLSLNEPPNKLKPIKINIQ
ncbi:DUF4179 domain-containing protein [Bacillus sp. 2205SS5-2]|uniref:DUF4179 domain-containing protein n=1 Tax=Bacillus sp. 2205SS5-2 TaxID=3109031 RepID=UPI003004EEE7